MKISFSKVCPILLLVLTLTACQTPKTKIDPTIVSTSYDYTKPADISNQSKPVWVLPVINQGWIPARVDPKTGDWISGHYQATIVQDGYWATQEEAELSGRPYIVAGETTPIVPPPVANVPSTGNGGAELNLTDMRNRISTLESKQSSPPEEAATAEQLQQVSAQLQAMAVDLPATTGTEAHTSQNTAGFTPSFRVPDATAPGTTSTPPTASPVMGDTRTLLLPAAQPGSSYVVPSGTSLGNIQVRQIDDTLVEVTFGGQTQQVRLHSPKDRVRITLPTP